MLTLCLYVQNELKRKNTLLHTFSKFSLTPYNAFLQMEKMNIHQGSWNTLQFKQFGFNIYSTP